MKALCRSQAIPRGRRSIRGPEPKRPLVSDDLIHVLLHLLTMVVQASALQTVLRFHTDVWQLKTFTLRHPEVINHPIELLRRLARSHLLVMLGDCGLA